MSFRTESFDVGKGRNMAIDYAGHDSAIILLHGIPGGPMAWHTVGAQLAKHHRVIIPHLLGFAGSSPPVKSLIRFLGSSAGRRAAPHNPLLQ